MSALYIYSLTHEESADHLWASQKGHVLPPGVRCEAGRVVALLGAQVHQGEGHGVIERPRLEGIPVAFEYAEKYRHVGSIC